MPLSISVPISAKISSERISVKKDTITRNGPKTIISFTDLKSGLTKVCVMTIATERIAKQTLT